MPGEDNFESLNTLIDGLGMNILIDNYCNFHPMIRVWIGAAEFRVWQFTGHSDTSKGYIKKDHYHKIFYTISYVTCSRDFEMNPPIPAAVYLGSPIALEKW